MFSTSQTRRRRPVGAVLAWAVAVAYAVTLFASPPALQAQSQSNAQIVGRWRPTTLPPNAPPNDEITGTSLYADPAARVLYAYHQTPGWVAAYDLDSLQPRGSGILAPGTRSAVLVDASAGLLYLAFADRGSGASRIDAFGMVGGTVKKVATLDTTAILTPGQEIVGMYRAPDKPILWLLSGRAAAGTLVGIRDVVVAELELPSGHIGGAVARWTKQVPSCEVLMHATNALPVALGYLPQSGPGGALYFGCGAYAQLGQSVPVARGAARLPLGPGATANASMPGDLEIFPTPGTFNVADSFFDPASGRLVFTTTAGGSVVIMFDAASNTYVGSFATGKNQLNQAALDPVAGRFYAVSQEANSVGLLMTDVRATPARQGYVFPEFYKIDGQAPLPHLIVTDPVTRRLILKYQGVDFVVVRDNVPRYEPLPPDDPDRNTVDVSEQEGKTTALFAAGAQGYGSRQRQVGGMEGLLVNYAIGGIPYQAAPGTRELRTAYLNSMSLSNGDAAASAITADRDLENTASDMGRLPGGERWPYVAAHCVDFGNEPRREDQGTTEVTCEATNARVSAESVFEDSNAGGVMVQRTTLDALGRRDEKRGAVSTAAASARGISVLGGLLEIGEVTASAEAVAKGRPGTAKTKYERAVKNVKVQGAELCGKDCDLQQLADRINSLLIGRVRVDFPKPDATAAAGSDGGYQALIRRSPFEQLQEQLFNEQAPNRIEVPAMVITVYQDDTVPSRTITELAALGVEARYGIALLSDDVLNSLGGDGGSFGDSGGSGDLAAALNVGSPVFGLDPTTPLQAGRVRPLGPSSLDPELASAGGLIWNGLKRTLQLLPIWAVLLIPVYLSARRWLLLQRDALVPGGNP